MIAGIVVASIAVILFTRRPDQRNTKERPSVRSVEDDHKNIHSDRQPTQTANQESQSEATLDAPKLLASSPVASDYAVLDPNRAGWQSESTHDVIKHQLEALGAILESAVDLDRETVTQLVSPDFTSGHLQPESLEVVFESTAFVVRRRTSEEVNSSTVFRGIEGAINTLREFSTVVHDHRVRRFDSKIFRITLQPGFANSTASIVFTGLDTSQPIQQNAIWECRWNLSDPSQPRLANIRVTDYEQIRYLASQERPFPDVANVVFGDNDCWQQQLVPGIDYWTDRIEQGLGMHLDGWSGLAIGDINNDGLDDIYVCQPGGLPNRLFLHQPDGTATDVAKRYHVDWLDRSTGALFVDLDNNGNQDLVLAIHGGVIVMQNRGELGFKLRQAIPTDGQPYSLATADFDNDSNLDIFVCCYNRGARAAQQGSLDVPVPYYDANNGAANLLLRNQGSFAFVDVTNDVGMHQNNRRFSYAAAWEDFDNDGDQDIYVANDFGRNNLYQNDNGTFTDVAAKVGVEDMGSGMSVAWSDYNEDGWMDLYVGNMFSAAGSRITYQRRFGATFNENALHAVRRLARGNTLFQNAGDGTMRDVSDAAGVGLGRWAWSSNFVDLNNDGRDDLIVANGFVTGDTEVDL